MECPICLNEWNSGTCIPKMIPCGHSLCNKCLTALFVPFVSPQKGGSVQCPTCMESHTLKSAHNNSNATSKALLDPNEISIFSLPSILFT